jgi:hypothetical protein
MKQTNFERTFLGLRWTTNDTALNGKRTEKKIKKNATARKNSFANAHCTHLPLPANSQNQPKGKVKRVQWPTLYFKTYLNS